MTTLSPYEISESNIRQDYLEDELGKLDDSELIERTNQLLAGIRVKRQQETVMELLRKRIREVTGEVPRNSYPLFIPEDEVLESLSKEELYAYGRYIFESLGIADTQENQSEQENDSETEEVEQWLARRDKRLEERQEQSIEYFRSQEEDEKQEMIPADLIEVPWEREDKRKVYVLAARKYKKVADRIKPVPSTFPEKYKTLRRIPSDPLIGIPVLPTKPPEFVPTRKFTRERKENMNINKDGFLWPEEEKLAFEIIRSQEEVFAWEAIERGKFRTDYFAPVVFPVIEHVPWSKKNLPIPPGLMEEICDIVRNKVKEGAYEPSTSSYRSSWFPVTKKDARALRVVHDLQPLNAVTIRDAGQIPFTEIHTEVMGGRGCYASFDLMVAYDQREIAEESRDLTTFQTPLGTFRLTCLPMGYTNAVTILQGDMCFVLQEEIPDPANPFMDDCPVIGPRTRYETDKQGNYLPSPCGYIPEGLRARHIVKGPDNIYYEVITENHGIRRFVWEHFQNVNRILQRVKKCGGTFSVKKSELCVPTVVSVGRVLTYEGRVPEQVSINKVLNWGPCETLTHVRGFLGVCGVVRIWVKDYAKKAKPLVNLTKKKIDFIWGPEQQKAMLELKEAVRTAPSLRPIDYKSDLAVVLAVDSSNIGVGWVLLQLGSDRKRYPSRFGSITWNERESRYSQPKLELYGLWRTLRAMRLFIIGVRKLKVEVDAKYISGMLKNPDIIPNATMNRWIVGISLFNFELVHVPAERHQAADGMSRREPVEGDLDEGGTEEEAEDWIDKFLGYAVEILNRQALTSTQVKIVSKVPEVYYQVPRTGNKMQSVAATYFEDDVTPEPGDYLPPMTEKTMKKNARLNEIQLFLQDPDQLPAKSKAEIKQLREAALRYMLVDGKLMRKIRPGKLLVIPPEHRRVSIMQEIHHTIGHKGAYTTLRNLKERFWWPSLHEDAIWFCKSCHICQTRQTKKIAIPPVITHVPSLFETCHMDTMLMPTANKYRYIVQARCALTSWPEWRALRKENRETLGNFIFEEILCRWGAVRTIVTDNGGPFKAALEFLKERYGIAHITISPYNKQANGLVEAKHFSVRESILKVADNEWKHWPQVAHSVFWAERMTIRRTVGYSPYYMVHGIEPVTPLDIAEATYLAPIVERTMSTTDLIAMRARQLLKRPEDLVDMRTRIKEYRKTTRAEFIKRHKHTMEDYNLPTGSLVLVRNTRIEMELDRKAKPRYLGPFIVIRKNYGGAYILAELNGSIWKSAVAAFRVIPYHERSTSAILDAKTLGQELFETVQKIILDKTKSDEEALEELAEAALGIDEAEQDPEDDEVSETEQEV